MIKHSGRHKKVCNTLSDKQKELLPYLAQGLLVPEIAKVMQISLSSAYSRANYIKDIVGCITHEELVEYAKKEMAHNDIRA
jgi:DNA-binding NarL/FixJ family response regulator